MKRIKKITILALVMILVLSCFSGCKNKRTSMSYTFKVETGDMIKVTLNTTDGYTMKQKEGTFYISKDDEEITQGVFATKDIYDEYHENVVNSEEDLKISQGHIDNIEYTYYETESKAGGIEYDYLIWIDDANTGVILASLAGTEKAQAVFKELNFKIDND